MAVRGVSRAARDLDFFTTDLRSLDEPGASCVPKVVSMEIRAGDADDPLAGVVHVEQAGERS
jgi:hypothetical protein